MVRVARSCSNCGYAGNEDLADRCAMCRAPLQARRHQGRTPIGGIAGESSGPVPALERRGGADSSSERGYSQRTPQPPSQGPISGTDMDGSSGNGTTRGGTQGRISHVERFDELPPHNVYRTLACLILIIMFGIPILIISILLGLLSLSFAIIGFAALSRFFSPYAFISTIWRLIELLVLGGVGRTDTTPVYRGMVETEHGEERQFLFRGPFESGNLVVGHHVQLTGTWREGTLIVTQGYDNTVRSAITTRFRNRWKAFFFLLLFILCIVVIASATAGFVFYPHLHGRLPWL